MTASASRTFEHQLRARGRETVITYEGIRWSGDALLAAAQHYGEVLVASRGAQAPGTPEDLHVAVDARLPPRVVVLCQPSPAALAVIVAHHIGGFVHTPLSSSCTEHELLHVLEDARPMAVVVDDSDEARISQISELLSARRLVAAPTADSRTAAPPPDCSLVSVGLHADGSLRVRLHAAGHRAALREASDSDASTLNKGAERWTAFTQATRPEGTTALMIYTSGTTGRPKGVELSYRALIGAMSSLGSLWQLSADDRVIVTLPLFHVHGLCIGIFASLLQGASVELHTRFAPDKVAEAVDAGGTVFLGVPTMYARLIEHMRAEPSARKKLAKARLFTAGSAALVPQHFQAFSELTGHHILERYGMSETLITLSNPLNGERRIGSVGLVVPGFEVRVVDEQGRDVAQDTPGELWVRGVGLMNGYHGRPDATAHVMRDGGWFTTGDIVQRDQSGYFKILGRSSVDIIKSGGFKMSALEIEDALAGAAGLHELTVLGIQDEAWGQIVCVVGVAADTTAAPRDILAALADLAATRLSKYKLPRALVLVPELPRSPLGKVQKPEIQRRIAAGMLPVYRAGD